MVNKTITYSALSAIITGLIVLGGITLTDKDVYYCEDRQMVMQCDKLTTYYRLDNGKCWNDKVGNKLCPSGWVKVTKDLKIPKKEFGKKYLCNTQECIKLEG